MIDIKRRCFYYVRSGCVEVKESTKICCNNFMHCLFIAFEVASGLASFLVFKVLVS